MLLSEFINLKEKPGCNMTEEGRACAVHGLTECPGYKMIETSAQEKLHQRHQEIRKKSGLPDPNYYKELRATFDLPDEERQAAVAALKRKYKIDEAGPFSYGARKPRKGSVADLAAKKRQEQERDKQPVEPKDHMVGVARVKKDVAEAIPYALSAANAAAEYQRQGNRHKGRIDIPVQSGEDYLAVGQALTKAARAAGHKIEYGRVGNKMSIFSDTMNSDELDQFIDDVLNQGVAEATGDPKFDAMMGKIAAEPKVPDMHPNMPPTSIPELLHWAKQNNKPYHYKFAEWAKKHNFTNVNDALEWFGDNVDPWDEFGPKEHLNVFGDIVGEPLIDAAKHNPKAAELLKVFACYEKIYDDWTDEYRQMKEQGLAEGSNRFQVGDKISFPLSQMATGIVDKIDDKRLYVKLDNGDVYTIPSSMLHSVKLLERQGVAEDQEDIVAIIDGVRSDRTYNDRYHAHNSLSKLVGYGKAKVAELYIDGEKVEHFELGKKYIDFEPKSLGSMSEAGPFSYGAKKPRKGSIADLAAKKHKEQEKGKLPAEPRDHMVGVARIIK